MQTVEWITSVGIFKNTLDRYPQEQHYCRWSSLQLRRALIPGLGSLSLSSSGCLGVLFCFIFSQTRQ